MHDLRPRSLDEPARSPASATEGETQSPRAEQPLSLAPPAEAAFLILVPDFASIGGVSNYYRALELERLGGRTRYFFVNTAKPETRPRMIMRLLANYRRFWRELAGDRYPWIIVNPSLSERSFYRDMVFCWLAFRRGRNVAVFFRGWSERLEARIRRRSLVGFLFRRTFARARHFIVLGDTFRERLLAMGCGPDSRFWIETTVADDRYLADFSISTRLNPPAVWQILFISRLVPSKGAAAAVEAFRLARQACPEVRMRLVVAGDGPELPRLRRLVEEAGVEGVVFTGAVAGEARKDALLSSHILLFPTAHDEGMPNVVLEAMLYGMPVLSRRKGSIAQVVQHGVNGFLADDEGPERFAQWIVRLVREPALYRGMASTNHETSSRFCTAARVRERFASMLTELLEGPAPAAGASTRRWGPRRAGEPSTNR